MAAFNNFTAYLTVGLSGVTDPNSSMAVNVREEIEDRWSDYKTTRRELDEKIAKARESSNVYSHTREQVRTLGALSGYTAEDLAMMSADQIIAARRASDDIQTAYGGLLDSVEYRAGLESMADSLSLMAVGLPLAVFGGPVGVLGAAAISGAGMFTSTYWDKYAELEDNPVYAGLTDEERHGISMAYGIAEGAGEAVGNLLFLKMPSILGVGGKLTSARIIGDPVLKRVSRMLGGVLIAQQLGGAEEYFAESTTAAIQLLADDFQNQRANGKVSNLSEWHQMLQENGGYMGFLEDNMEAIAEAGRIGYGMGLTMGGGSAVVGYARNEYVRQTNPDKYALMQFAEFIGNETSLDALNEQELADFQKLTEEYTKIDFTERGGEAGKALKAKIDVYVEKLGGSSYSTKSRLLALAENNPAAVYDAYVMAQQIKNAERLTGKYEQDSKGRWKLNGRFIGDPTNTELYKLNQKLSEEKKAELREEVSQNKKNLAELIRTGQYAEGFSPDKRSELGRITGVKRKIARAEGSFVIDKDTDLKDLGLSRRERRMYAAVQRKLRDGETIVVQPDGSALNNDDGRYVEYEDGTKEIHVVAGSARSAFALMHENGHLFMEESLQNPETRRRVFNETISALESSRQFSLFTRVLSVMPGMEEQVKAMRKSGGIGGAVAIYESMTPEQKAAFERELITHYLDQIAQGKMTDSKGFNTAPVIRSMFADFFDSRIGADPVSLESIARNYMSDVRRANGGLLGLERAQDELRAAEENEAIVQAEAKAAEEGLSSTRLPSFAGGKVVMQFNRNAFEGEISVKYKTITRNFNSFGHLVGYWRRMTANGMRPVIGQMAYEINGQYVHIKPTAGWIKKDEAGNPITNMSGATSSRQFQLRDRRDQANLELELRTQQSELGREVADMHKKNFKFKGFSLDYHSFFDPKYNGKGFRALMAAKQNMQALIDKGYDREFFDNLRSDKKFQYLINFDTNPELFRLAETEGRPPLEDQAAKLVSRAESLGVEAWRFALPGSVVYLNQTSDLYGANQQEMDDIAKAIDQYENGGQDGGINFEGTISEGLSSSQLPPPPAVEQAARDYDIVEISDSVASGMRGVHHLRVLKYDWKRAGNISIPIRTAKGRLTSYDFVQAGGPFGAIENLLRGGKIFGPSHLEKSTRKAFSATAEIARQAGESEYGVLVSLRNEDNSLRSTHSFIDFFGYLEKYERLNRDQREAIISALEEVINSASSTGQYTIIGKGGKKETVKITFEDSDAFSELDLDGLALNERGEYEITDLMAFFKKMQQYDYANALGFTDRQAFLTSFMHKLSSATARRKGKKKIPGSGVVTKKEFLGYINEPAFKGMEQGTIVAGFRMSTDPQAQRGGAFDLRGRQKQGAINAGNQDLAEFYEATSFGFGIGGVTKMIVPKSTGLQGKMIGDALEIGKPIKEGGQSSMSATYRIDAGLASRRLPGRIYMEGNSSWEKSSATPYGAMLQAAAIKYQDRFSDVLLLQQDVEVFRKHKVPESMDFEMALDVYYGRVRNDLEQLEAVVKDIQKDLRSFGISNKDLSDYLYAKHAIERNADILAKDPTMRDGSGMTDAEAIAIINRLETSDMMKVADRVYKLVENTRDTMVQGGLESAAVVDAWRKRYKFYVPLNGLAVDELSDVTNDYPTGGSGMAVYGPSVKKARGRRSKTEHNLLSNIVMQNAAVKQRARKDKAMLSLYNLVKNNPNEKVWRVIGPKNGMNVRGRNLTAAELKQSPNAVPIRINGEQHFIYFQDASYAMALNGMTIEKLNKINASMAKYIGFLRNSYTVWNPAFFISNFARDFEMAIANAAAEIEREGGILQGYGLDTKTFVRALTKTTFTTMKALVKESALGFAGAKLDPQTQAYMEEWKASGGQTGFSYSETLNEVVAKLNGLTNKTPTQQKAEKVGEFLSKFYANPVQFFKYVEGLNEAFENSVRLAAYIEARRAGMTASRAAQLSKNITVNFNKSGEYTPGINSWFLFFNASVQGSTRLARSLRKNEMYVDQNQGGTTNKWHNRLSTTAKISAGMVLFSAMQTLFNIAMSDEEEDGVSYYDKIPDYRKERNWIIMAGPRDPIYIPLPYGLNIFHNLGMLLAEVGSGHREIGSGAAFLAGALHSSFSPIGFGQYDTVGETVTMALTPTALKPGTETFLFNKTYFGSQVYREQLPFGTEVPEYQLAYRSPDYLIEFAKYLNQLSGGTTEVSGDINVNPDPYYYLAQSLTGGAGKFVGDIAELSRGMVAMTRKNIDRAASDGDFIKSLLNVEEDEVIQIRRSDIPLLKLMYGEASRFYDTDLYMKNINELKQAEREMKEGESTDFDVTGVQALRSQAKRTADMLEKIRDLKKKARETEDYVDRQNAIYKLQEAERMEYMLFNATYEELRGQYIN